MGDILQAILPWLLIYSSYHIVNRILDVNARHIETTGRLQEYVGGLADRVSALERGKLEIKPLPGEVISHFTEPHGETHFRMELHNSGVSTLNGLQVRLTNVEPRPILEHFRHRADFPYSVRPAHLAEGMIDRSERHDLNSGTKKNFELLYYWAASDGRIMIDGIDTKQNHSRDSRLSIEDQERWTMFYEVSGDGIEIQKPTFIVQRQGKDVVVSRLT